MKDKKVIAIIITDPHLHENNINEVTDIFIQLKKLGEEHRCNSYFLLGDVFDSRISQREEVLTAFSNILNNFENDTIYCIPGNHDKTDYKSNDSFITPYKHFPGFELFDKGTVFNFKGYFNALMIPFFDEKVWIEDFNYSSIEALNNIKIPKILFSHISITGSVNNNGEKVENGITASLFKDFNKVFLGHYHNQQQVGKNIFHLPSPQQKDFGEDSEKGFTLLYEDLSHEFVKSSFKEFEKIKIDLNDISLDELKDFIKEVDTEKNVRFELWGDKGSLKSFDKTIFVNSGIDVKMKSKALEEFLLPENEGFTTVTEIHSSESLIEEFKEFCDVKQYDFEEGQEILKQVL